MVVIKFVYIEQCWFNKHIKEPYILHYPSSGCSFKAVSFVSIASVRVCCMRKLLDFYDGLILTLFTVFDMLHFLLVQVKN